MQDLETNLEFLLRPYQRALVDPWPRPKPARMASFFTGADIIIIEERRKAGQSTSRRDYFRDLFLALPESARFKLLSNILNTREANHPAACAEIRAMMSGGSLAPSATIPEHAWNADRLNEYLKDMDGAIASGEYERTVTMAYTCLEGFLGAFLRAKAQRASYPNEIVALSKEVCDLPKNINKEYPEMAVTD